MPSTLRPKAGATLPVPVPPAHAMYPTSKTQDEPLSAHRRYHLHSSRIGVGIVMIFLSFFFLLLFLRNQPSKITFEKIVVKEYPEAHRLYNFRDTSPVAAGNQNRSTWSGKTLVVLIGGLRCGERAWKSLYDNVVEWNTDGGGMSRHKDINSSYSTGQSVNAVDLALAVGTPLHDGPYANATLFQKAKYVFPFPEYADWSEALDLIDPNWKSTVAPHLAANSQALGGVRYKKWQGSGAISFWIRWFLSKHLIQHDLIGKYDRFVITRADHFYMCPHDLSSLDPQYLWVPFGLDYGGVSDRHLIVSSEHVLAALDVLPGLFQEPWAYPLGETGYNPERLLWDRWKRSGLAEMVRRSPRMMFACGNPNIEDSTRSSHQPDEMAVPEGVRKKYRKEYILSEGTCRGRDYYS